MKNLLPILLILCYSASAQKIKLISGSLKDIKGQTSFAIQFSYDSMLVGKDTHEKDYLKDLRMRWEAEETGKGTAFVNKWFDDRKRLYEPSFIQNFEKFSDLKLNDSISKYTLLLKTKLTEGGWNVGVAETYAIIAGELWVVESADHTNIKAKIVFYDSRGDDFSGGDFHMTNRIKSAYESAGKWLGIFVYRKLK